MELPDGTYIPSHVRVGSNLDHKDRQRAIEYGDCYLRVGSIVQAYNASDPANRNKKYVEYDVEVIHSILDGGLTKIIYPRCQVSSLFGGIADFIRWTPRIDTKPGNSTLSVGSNVLIACVNGQSRFAYIISGIPNPNATFQETFDSNHHFTFRFNGLAAEIDDDGQLSVTRLGPTDATGKVTSSDSTNNQFLSFDSNGGIKLGYNNPHIGAGIFLDEQSDTVDIVANSHVLLQANGPVLVTTPAGLQINGATQQFVNGTTYRLSESVLNTSLAGLNTALATLATTAGQALTTAAPLLLIPVVGPILASPLVAEAAVALLGMTTVFTGMQTLQVEFESQAELYLSNVNRHDDGGQSYQVPPAPPEVVEIVDDTPTNVPLQYVTVTIEGKQFIVNQATGEIKPVKG